MKSIITTILIGFFALSALSQSSSDNNTPFQNNHLGWDDTQQTQLRITQNNQNRMLFNTQLSWTGINNESATNVNRITLPHTGVALDNQVAWSMLHLWDNDDSGSPFTSNMRRAWMDVGLSMTGNQDFLYLGLLNDPLALLLY